VILDDEFLDFEVKKDLINQTPNLCLVV